MGYIILRLDMKLQRRFKDKIWLK